MSSLLDFADFGSSFFGSSGKKEKISRREYVTQDIDYYRQGLDTTGIKVDYERDREEDEDEEGEEDNHVKSSSSSTDKKEEDTDKEDLLRCSQCEMDLPRTSFSASQLKKKAKRKCKGCK